jgi:protein-S-isoprenylcysteine O-methyltransferase Ste14
MEFSAAVLITLNDALVCLLPVIFFRRDGALTPMWLITASPYAIAPLVTWCVYYRVLAPSIDYVAALAFAGVLLSTLSILMMGLTLGSHRIPLALWHQKPENDAPQHIVDWGIYRRIRHPFYSSFILLMIANTLIAQNIWAFAVLAYVVVILTFTAQKEERRLSAESGGIGEHYRKYMTTTGRFFPRWSIPE